MSCKDPGLGGLELWLLDAIPAHPLLGPDLPPQFLATFDSILRAVDAANPLRVARKRETFRKISSFGQLLEQRAELLAASMLARAGVEFDFAADHPDLLLRGASCGVEVGTRAVDGPYAMQDALEALLLNRPDLHVTLTFDGRPLKLAKERYEHVAQEIATGVYEVPTADLRFDDLGVTARVELGTGPADSQVMITFGGQSGSDLTEHMAEVGREIDNKIAEKRRQAEEVPTLLLLDIARVGWAWLRPGSVWLPLLESKMAIEPIVGLGVMISTLDSDEPLQLHAILKPEAPQALADALRRLVKRFNLET